MAKGNHIPGTTKAGLLARKSFVETVSSGPPVLAASVTSWNIWGTTAGYLLAGGAFWLFLAAIVKVLHARTLDRATRLSEDHDGLLGSMHVLRSTVARRCGMTEPADDKLRVTIHRVVPPDKDSKSLVQATEIEQIVPYVGGEGGGQGRRFSIRSGVTGHAIRTGQPAAGSRMPGNELEYVKEQVSDWGYTHREAEALTRGRHSFMAVPIQNRQAVVGVVYLDSSESSTFLSADVVEVILAACGGISRYVEERY